MAADQATKAWVLGHAGAGGHHLLGPLGMRVGRNTGVAFSLFTGHSGIALVVTLALAAVVAVCARFAASPAAGVVFGLLVGGAIGNDIDRVARAGTGGVVDFLTLPHFPTFNLADTAITFGTVGLVALVALRRPITVRR